MENASHQYSYAQIEDMINHQRHVYNWEFVFLGANIDAVETAATLGIPRHMAKTYTASSEGCSSTFVAMDHFINYMKQHNSSEAGFSEDCCRIMACVK